MASNWTRRRTFKNPEARPKNDIGLHILTIIFNNIYKISKIAHE